MKLSDLIQGCALKKNLDPILAKAQKMDQTMEIDSISSRAQDIQPGGLFLAVKGYSADGHDYMAQAIENGAGAIIAQENPGHLDRVILVEDSRQALAIVAANFYGRPSREMILVGITGTNGKTTTTWILESIFIAAGFCCGVIGTINIRYQGKTFANPTTTPDAIELQKALYQMKQAGVTHVIMEVSSHGLDQFRVEQCEFDAGVFTNLSQDHLDYHGTMEKYFQCKQRFFTDFLGPKSRSKTAPAVINIDDPMGRVLADSISYPKILVSRTQPADVAAHDILDDINGLSGRIGLSETEFPLKSSLTGRFNLENILCAVGAAQALGIDPSHIRQGIEALTRVPGRLEKVINPIHRYLFVDYAHTPDALESILATLTRRAPARVITVFGCGGDRDRTKRPIMGKIACQYSDIAIVTSDNPRTEAPEAIVNDILAGIRMDRVPELDMETLLSCPDQKGYFKEVDRRKALETAVMISRPSDIIVAAGKGHETYQITRTGTLHFDDTEELILACKKFETRFAPIEWSCEDLIQALGQTPFMNTLGPGHRFTLIHTDSRTMALDQVFLALKGENFDGHGFILDLIEKGVQGVVAQKGFFAGLEPSVQQRLNQKKLVLFETHDTLEALGCLARYQRLRSKVKLVAITGSNGKTTTRQLTQEIFNTQFHTLATLGNLNNEIGVPLTLLKLSHAHEWAIVEMGMNHPGEISRLSRMACPDIAIITNTSGAHLKGLKTVENVARAKAEIFEHVRENGTALIFAHDPRYEILESNARKNSNITQILTFGTDSKTRPDIRAWDLQTNGQTTLFQASGNKVEKALFSIYSPAPFMVNNALAAIAAAELALIPPQQIRTGLNNFTPVSGRMKMTQLSNGIHLIDDTYNANPASMTQALKTLVLTAKEKTAIAILGDMLELGQDSDQLHRDMGNLVAHLKVSWLFLFGNQVAHIQQGALEKGFPEDRIFWGTKEKIAQQILKAAGRGDWILLKGSRGMKMETLISEMNTQLAKEDYGTP